VLHQFVIVGELVKAQLLHLPVPGCFLW